MDNEVVDEKYCVDLRDYYKKLDKPEKGMLLSYLTGEIGFGYSTLVNKFAGRLRFSRVDIWVIRKVITLHITCLPLTSSRTRVMAA